VEARSVPIIRQRPMNEIKELSSPMRICKDCAYEVDAAAGKGDLILI
jgi:hypothetical protein